MSNISQFYTPASSSSFRQNRRVFVGPLSTTWTVPPNVFDVEVHCWGGGGNQSAYTAGGGGGYVTHIYPVTPGQVLSITVGDREGTSSVSCPSQSPTSPISATGGTSPTGGSGSFTIAPGISTTNTFAFSGGNGGTGSAPNAYGGGGASAGSPYGRGKDGIPATSAGAGGAGLSTSVDGSPQANGGSANPYWPLSYPLMNSFHSYSLYSTYNNNPVSIASTFPWFYVRDIVGVGATVRTVAGQIANGIGAGSGGGGTNLGVPGAAGNGSFLGGGGGTGAGGGGGNGGIAGGGGGGTVSTGLGGAGCVIIYW